MKKKGLIIIIIILLIMLIASITYIICNKTVIADKEKRKNEKVDTIKETDDKLDINSYLVNQIIAKLEQYRIYGGLVDAIPYDETNEVVINDVMSDAEKGRIAYNFSNLGDEYFDATDKSVENGIKITEEGVSILKSNFKKIFGYEGFKESNGCPNIKYENNNYYKIVGCGVSPYINTSAVYVTSAKKSGNDIILYGKVVFALWNGPSDTETFEGLKLSANKYYEEKQNAINKLDENTYTNITQANSNDIDNLYVLLNQYAKENSDLLDTYAYTFKQADDDYYLYSVKRA